MPLPLQQNSGHLRYVWQSHQYLAHRISQIWVVDMTSSVPTHETAPLPTKDVHLDVLKA